MIRSKLQQMMYGRNGADQLSVFTMWASIFFWALFLLTQWPVFYILSLVLIFCSFFRMFSRRLDKRRSENAKFLSMIRPVLRRFSALRCRMRDKDHRYFRCPNCGQQMRVPKGKGRIQVTCRSCGITFEEKS